jgi:hypothetical protein
VYPDHHAPGGLDTPPMTDVDYSSQLDTESDHGSLDMDSDIERHPSNTDEPLSTISEGDISSPSVLANESWSVVDLTDGESEFDAGLDGLSLLPDTISESTCIPAPRLGTHFTSEGHPSSHHRVCGHYRTQERSASSPSPSPAHNSWFRDLQPLSHQMKDFSLLHDHHQTFYDYLFS